MPSNPSQSPFQPAIINSLGFNYSSPTPSLSVSLCTSPRPRHRTPPRPRCTAPDEALLPPRTSPPPLRGAPPTPPGRATPSRPSPAPDPAKRWPDPAPRPSPALDPTRSGRIHRGGVDWSKNSRILCVKQHTQLNHVGLPREKNLPIYCHDTTTHAASNIRGHFPLITYTKKRYCSATSLTS